MSFSPPSSTAPAEDPVLSSTLLTELHASELPHRVATLIFVLSSTHVLLGMKKRGFGDGKWNGFGGKVESGDLTIKHAAARELEEESGLTIDPFHFISAGVIFFDFDEETTQKKVDNHMLVVHVFVVDSAHAQQEPVESEEMRPEWYSLDAIPYDRMWIDDSYWLSKVLEEHRVIEAAFRFFGFDVITEFQIEERGVFELGETN